MSFKAPALRLLTALMPLALTPVFAELISNGTLNFGGGCKDIILVLPWILWSTLYLIACIFLWIRRTPLGKAIVLAVAFSTALSLILYLILIVLARIIQ